MTNAPVMTAPLMLCAYCHHAHGFRTSSQKLLSCTDPSARLEIAHGMLHPGIGRDDEESREPRAQKHRNRRPPVGPRTEPLLSVQEQSKEGGLQEEGEHAFHGQRLADHASGEAREVRPVRAELKFHRNSGNDSHHKVDAEDPGPEARGLVIGLVIAAQSQAS